MGDRGRGCDRKRRPGERVQLGPERGRARLDQVARCGLLLGRHDRDLELAGLIEQALGDPLAQPG
jgi:hypothetical protein